MHGILSATCTLCDLSHKEKRSLIDIEIPIVISRWKHIRSDPDTMIDYALEKHRAILSKYKRHHYNSHYNDQYYDDDYTPYKSEPILPDVEGPIIKIVIALPEPENEIWHQYYYAGLKIKQGLTSRQVTEEYLEQDVLAVICATKIDNASSELQISPGAYIDHYYTRTSRFQALYNTYFEFYYTNDGQSTTTKDILKIINQYRRGKTVLQTHELVLSHMIKELIPDDDDFGYGSSDIDDWEEEREDPYYAYEEEKEEFLDHDDNDEYSDNIEERTHAWDAYVRLHDAGWTEDD